MQYECGKTGLFKCIFCDKRVKQKYNLYAHVSSVHPMNIDEFVANFKSIKPIIENKKF